MSHARSQLEKIFTAFILMGLGALLFKFVPMYIWGQGILFDASLHIIIASFALYIIWFYIDQNISWRLPFFIFATLILFVISVQRIIANAHNDIGLIMGLVISLLAIGIAERKNLKGKLKF